MPAPYEKSKSLGSGGSMVARLKLKGIDGRAHQVWILRLNLTQHGETYQFKTRVGLTDWEFFLDSLGGGAWPYLVGGLICLLNCVNERDLNLLNRRSFHKAVLFLEGLCNFNYKEVWGNYRSVMPLDILGRTRSTMTSSESFLLSRKSPGNLYKTSRVRDRSLQL